MAQNSFSIPESALGGEDYAREFSLLREYGFANLTLGYKWRTDEQITEQELEHLQNCLQESGVKVQDVHGQHPHQYDIGNEDKTKRKLAYDLFVHRLEVTNALGADAMVYHVPTKVITNSILDRYVENLKRLETKARDLGVAVALENHYIADIDKQTFTRCFEEFDPEYIGFTLDPGHGNKSGNLDWLLDNCMHRLKILHLNDNDGKADSHQIPLTGAGTINWDKVAKAIAKSPYDKPLQFEVGMGKNKQYTRDNFLETMAKVGQKMQEKVAGYKS